MTTVLAVDDEPPIVRTPRTQVATNRKLLGCFVVELDPVAFGQREVDSRTSTAGSLLFQFNA